MEFMLYISFVAGIIAGLLLGELLGGSPNDTL